LPKSVKYPYSAKKEEQEPMEHGTTLLAVIHIVVAFLLVTIVLLQDSKGGGMGGAFGGGGSQTLFGATGAANFLVKLTRGLAVIFMCTCIGLTLILTHRSTRSVVDSLPTTKNPLTTNGPAGPGPAVPLNGAAPVATAAPQEAPAK
jgi:preprotein translocase subunit SecG